MRPNFFAASLLATVGATAHAENAPRTYTSMPVHLAFVEEDEMPPQAFGVDGSHVDPTATTTGVAGPCAFELRTAAIAVSTHDRYPDGTFFLRNEGIAPGTVIDGEVRSRLWISVSSDVDARLIGTTEAQAACKKQLAKKPLRIGKVSMAGTNLYGVESRGVRYLMTRNTKSNEVTAVLTLDAATGDVVVVDRRGLPVALDSAVYSLRSDERKLFDLIVEPKLSFYPREP